MKRFSFLMMCILSLSVVVSDVVAAQSQTPAQTTSFHQSEFQLNAEALNLSQRELQRYNQLMQGPLRFWNPKIDPLLALGMFEDDPAQRVLLAERYARQEHALLTRLQQFEGDYRTAFNRLFPEASVIDERKLQAYYTHQALKASPNQALFPSGQLQKGDRVLYFPDLTCTTSCQSEVNRLVRWIILHAETVLDIYVKGATSETDVRHWAKQIEIPVEQVKAGYITLNINRHQYQELNAHDATAQPSRFYLSRENQVYRIDPAQVRF